MAVATNTDDCDNESCRGDGGRDSGGVRGRRGGGDDDDAPAVDRTGTNGQCRRRGGGGPGPGRGPGDDGRGGGGPERGGDEVVVDPGDEPRHRRRGSRSPSPSSSHSSSSSCSSSLSLASTSSPASSPRGSSNDDDCDGDSTSPPRSKSNTHLAVGVLSILLAALFLHPAPPMTPDEVQSAKMHRFLSTFVCRHPRGYCHPNLKPEPGRRTHSVDAGADIPPGTPILKLPRDLLVTDWDALWEAGFVERFGAARHGETGNPLDSGAYLALHLVLRRRQNQNQTQQHQQDHMAQFLEQLPTHEAMSAHHPTLWRRSTLTQLLGGTTVALPLAEAFRSMMGSEFDAFVSLDGDLRMLRKEYMAARVHVMSRSFGTGPVENLLPEADDDSTSDRETVERLREVAGVDLTRGCRAMSPILDAWDHHANAPTRWRYLPDPVRSFAVETTPSPMGGTGLRRGDDVWVSYGTYTDAHLFAKFGFVNGDGSGHTEVSLAVHHRVADLGMGQQWSHLPFDADADGNDVVDDVRDDALDSKRREYARRWREGNRGGLLRYLRFDDGYARCIEPPSSPISHSSSSEPPPSRAWELKRLKFLHLLRLADDRHAWTVTMKPRNPDAVPPSTSSDPPPEKGYPPKFQPGPGPGGVRFDGSRIISTCRLVALTEWDYGGDAVRALRDALRGADGEGGEESISIPRQTDPLEYRALAVLRRWTTLAISRFPNSIEGETELLLLPSSSSAGDGTAADGEGGGGLEFGSREWHAAHVRLGELQTLHALRSVAVSGMNKMRSGMLLGGGVGKEDLVIREEPCPPVATDESSLWR